MKKNNLINGEKKLAVEVKNESTPFSFAVLDKKKTGNVVMRTTHKDCLYDKETLERMYNAGYKFEMDGKKITLKCACELTEEGKKARETKKKL